MPNPGRVRVWLARLAAPAALLLAGTAAVLLIQNARDSADEARTTTAATTGVTTRPATATTPDSPPPPPAATTAAEFYRVQSGDTLETIADQYGTTVEELLALNPDVDPIELSIGQRIRVQ